MHQTIRLAIVVIIVGVGLVAAQEQSTLTQAQRVVIENPEIISLKLKGIIERRHADVYEENTGPFKPKGTIRFELVATNNSAIPLEVRSWDHFYQNRPLLLKDDQEVPYRHGISRVLAQKDTDGGLDIVHLFVIRLPPGEAKSIDVCELNDWYPRLPPGHYQLMLRHRFLQGGKLVNSAAITFEVADKPSR